VAGSRSYVTSRLLATPAAPGRARHLVAEASRGLPAHLVDDAVLATSELVTNSVQHAVGVLTLLVERAPHGLAVAVADSSAANVTATNVSSLADRGRGLALVAELSDAWGCRATADGTGKVVWFRIGGHERWEVTVTDADRIDLLQSQVSALARALNAVITGGIGDVGSFANSPGLLNGAGKARELLQAADLWRPE